MMMPVEFLARGMRVLLIDNDADERTLLRGMLVAANGGRYEITEAGTVAQAKASIAEMAPDCILLDCDLPDGNGLALLRDIVGEQGIHAFGIVMLTDSGATVPAVEALHLGAHDFLLKEGISDLQVRQAVRSAIEKAAIHRELAAKRAERVRKGGAPAHLDNTEQESAERPRAELALKDQEAFLQSVIGAATDCVKVLDLEGRLRWMSENGQRMLEVTDFSQIEGREWASLWSLDGKEEQARAAVAAAAAGKIACFHARGATMTGAIKWWETVVSPIQGRDGRVEKILCVSRDVSDRHAADMALRQSEERLRLATAAGKAGIWDWDILTDKVTWTESLYAMHGLKPGEFAGTLAAFSALVHPEDVARVKMALDNALAGAAPYELEMRVVQPDGEIRWIFTNASVIREEGQAVRMLGASLDITDRKRREGHAELLSSLGQRLGLLSGGEEMLQVAQEAIGRHLGVQRCFFFEVDDVKGRAVIHDDWRGPEQPSLAGTYAFEDYGTPELVSRLAQARFSVDDVTKDPAIGTWAKAHLRNRTRAVAVAAFHREGRWVASLGVGAEQARHWREDELALLEDALARVWPYVEKARADRLLFNSAEQLKLAASAARLGPWVYDKRADRVTFSERAAEIFGLSPGASLSWEKMQALLHEDDRERGHKATEVALAARTEYSIEYRLVRADGSTRWVASNGRGQYDETGLIGVVGVVQDVTERKEAERATRQLAAIVESSDDAIVSKNLQGVVLTWNAAAERVFGYTTKEMIGTPITVLLPPEHYDEEPLILERIRRGERIEHYETRRRHKTGRILDVSLTVSPIKDENGWIVGASKIARDITQRKATEAALVRRTQGLEILNRLGAGLVMERELENIVQAVTDAGREIAGAQFGAFFYNRMSEPGGALTLYAISGLPKEAFAKFPMPRATALFGPTFRGEGTVRVADVFADERYGKNAPHQGMPAGHPPVRSYLAASVRAGSGDILGGLFFGHDQPGVFTQEAEEAIEALCSQAGIAIENARLHQAVQRELAERKLAREAVRAREEQLRLVTNHAPVLLLQCDRGYRYKFANEPYAQRYGHTTESLLGQTIAEVAGEAAFAAARESIDRALEGQTIEFEIEIPYQHLGSRWVHVVFVPEPEKDGEVPGFVGVLTDITQRKSAERELERARDEALAGSRAKDDFLAALSHELRTPLNPVLLLASDAANNTALPEEIRDVFETIRRQVNLEARLIDDLLDLTRITRGKLSLDRRIIDAHQVLKDAIITVRSDVEEKKLRFVQSFDARAHTVFGDAVRLQQVFWNVLKNAVKFTSAGGRISVTTSVREKPSRLRVAIEDTGIGLTPVELGRIFEAFSQGAHASDGGSHRFGGLGLGLAISRSLVEMHGGEIHASSPGRNLGAIFVIELPLMSASTSTENSFQDESTGIRTPDAPGQTSRGRLLVVEDHAPTRNTLKNLLSRRGFDVSTAGSAIEALEVARQQAPDLIISDIGLPDSDGCKLLIELRLSNPSLPGIALSGYGMEEDLARTRAAGFTEHLTKPINVGALERAIEKFFPRT